MSTQITKDSKLWDWHKKYPLILPFGSFPSGVLTRKKDLMIDGSPASCTEARSLIAAMVYYCLEQLKAEVVIPGEYATLEQSRVAIGTNSDSAGSEDIYVEFKKDAISQYTQIVKYSPSTGEMKITQFNSATRRPNGFKLYGASSADRDPGYCIFLALIPVFEQQIPNFSDCLKRLKNLLINATPFSAHQVEIADFYHNELLAICYRVYDALALKNSIKLMLPPEDQAYPTIKTLDIESGKVGPGTGKTILGTFEIFKEKGSKNHRAAEVYTIDPKDVAEITFTKNDFSFEERMMIPEIPKDNVMPKDIVDIVKEMKSTWHNPPATKITQILMEGAAGSGKSYNARLLAAVLKRPFISYVCSPTDSKEDLIGSLLPFVKEQDPEEFTDLNETDRKLYKVITTCNGEEMYDKMAEVMGLPGGCECFYDPEGSYEAITGNTAPASITAMDAFMELQTKLSHKVKQLMEYSKTKVAAMNFGKEFIQGKLEKILEAVNSLNSSAAAENDEAKEENRKKLTSLQEQFDRVLGFTPENNIDVNGFAMMYMANPAKTLDMLFSYAEANKPAKESDPADNGVEYKYIPSAILRAIQNGWVLEIQEPTCLVQQGALSCLFDVLEKESIGMVNTVVGDVKKHPDFVCVATMNRKYKGTKPLNEAARSRFQYFVKLETPSEEVIMERLRAKVGIQDNDLLAAIATAYKKLEEKTIEINTTGAATLRGLYAFADAVKRGEDIYWAKDRYLLWSITTDEDELSELNIALEDTELFHKLA